MQSLTISHDSRVPTGLFLGLTTVDIIFEFDRYPEEDTKNTARRYTTAAGGPASNAAVAFAYLGGVAQAISSLGTSSLADIARRDLLSHRVRHLDITAEREAEPALSAIAVVSTSGSRTIFTSPAIDDDLEGPFVQATVARYLAGVDILLLDGHQGPLAAHVARHARDIGVTVVLDGDLYGPNTDAFLQFVDIVIFGKSFRIPRKVTQRDTFEHFEHRGIKHVIATNGNEPIEFVTDGVTGTVVVEQVSAVDTLAAGDFFHGAFCYAYIIGRDIERALRFASKVASQSVTSFGTRDWMKEHEPIRFE